MQQIAEWLEKLGMSEYGERFAKNDIDVSVLRHLTDQDLKELWHLPRAPPKDAGCHHRDDRHGSRSACSYPRD